METSLLSAVVFCRPQAEESVATARHIMALRGLVLCFVVCGSVSGRETLVSRQEYIRPIKRLLNAYQTLIKPVSLVVLRI